MRGWILAASSLLAACAVDQDVADGALRIDSAPESGWRIIQAGDFDGDGLADALWSNPIKNRIAIALVRGEGHVLLGPEIPGPDGVGWDAVTSADFDGDGRNDVLWYHPGDNRFRVSLMWGTHVVDPGVELAGPPGDGWNVATSAGDVDGDGLGDIVFYNSAIHRFTVWRMRGTVPLARGAEIPEPPGEGWSVVNTGDFNADGMQDILWFNETTQRWAAWLMRGTDVLEAGPEMPAPHGGGWIVENTGDFNADGMQDILWFNPLTKHMSVTLVRGTHILEAGPPIPGPPGDGWTASAAGDVDGDGLADAFWWTGRMPTRMALWGMRGTRLFAPGHELPGPL